ncbi:hypothetical protein ABE489_20950, partial [Pseudomonas sp. TWI698]|uniref:hypothetical protein n=2 Tax=unclassified Pseudomonas TaxID=196821 RepID=UPI003207A489
ILLGFLRNPKLGSAISNDYVISRMVTCDADNLSDYQSILTSTHTNCLIRFVKERLVKSFSSQPRRAFYAFLRACQAFILKFLRETRSTSNTWLAAISRSGRRIIQHLEALSTTISTAIDQAIEAPPVLPGLSNSLNFKEFLIPTTLEVGRIIRGFERPSRLNFNKP